MKIKGFDKDLKCRGMQFEIGKEYKIELNGQKMELCTDTVFHYCNNLRNVHNFYDVLDNNNRFCEIKVLGEEVTDNIKCGSNHIKILREIQGEELNQLKDLIDGNTGAFNSGYYNSGNYNSGHRNSGYYNSGHYNSGNRNSGNRNSGNRNSGHYNSCNFSNGIFCTEEEKIRLFNKPSDFTMYEFLDSVYFKALCSSNFTLTEWIDYTEEEMAESLCRQALGGYLKTYTYKEACKNWWKNMTEENKEIVKNIPNFDKDIFFEITGIELNE